MPVCDQLRPDKITYIVDVDEAILSGAIFNYFTLVSDEERVAYCPLLLHLLRDTPTQHNLPYALHSFKMEKTKKGGTRFIMKAAQPYIFTEEQIQKTLEIIHNHIQPAWMNEYPKLDEEGLILAEEKKRKLRGEFYPDKTLQESDPKEFSAQTALYYSLKEILPGVRAHTGDLVFKKIEFDDAHKKIHFHFDASGSCMECGSAGPTTIKALRNLLIEFSHEESLADGLEGYEIGSIHIYDQENPNNIAYSVSETGVHRFPTQKSREFEWSPG